MLYNIFSMIRIIMTSMGGEAGEYNRDGGGGGGAYRKPHEESMEQTLIICGTIIPDYWGRSRGSPLILG